MDDPLETWRKREGILFVVSAPSGAGKTTLCREAIKGISDLISSISYTTRSPRPNEVGGKDYFFVSHSEFHEMIKKGEFAEWAEVHGNLYGTPKVFLKETINQGKDVLLAIDSQGAMQLRRSYEGVYVYILSPSLEVLRSRLRARRSDAPDEIRRRLIKAIEEIPHYQEYDYLIVNEDLNKAMEELKSVIVAERIRVSRIDPQWVKENFSKLPPDL